MIREVYEQINVMELAEILINGGSGNIFFENNNSELVPCDDTEFALCDLTGYKWFIKKKNLYLIAPTIK